jgi:hypothetical protein
MKNRITLLIMLSIFFITACQHEADTNILDGTWQIFRTQTEKNKQNPVAYWLSIDNNRFQWGDGDFIIDSGEWVLDEAEMIVLLDSDNGTENDTEWTLNLREDTLTLEGTENKTNSYQKYMEAVKTKKRPQHFRDRVIGNWKFEEVSIDSVLQPKIDDAFIEFNINGKWYASGDSGIWDMNSYVPILSVNAITGQPINEWLILFERNKTNQMNWIGTSSLGQDKYQVKLSRK